MGEQAKRTTDEPGPDYDRLRLPQVLLRLARAYQENRFS